MPCFFVDILNTMKNLYLAIIAFIVLIFLAALWFFFGSTIISLFQNDNTNLNIAPIEEVIEPKPLTKEEKLDLLDELVPEDLIDTQEEIDEQVNLLNQLQNPEPQAETQDLFENLEGNVPAQDQLDLLNQLQN